MPTEITQFASPHAKPKRRFFSPGYKLRILDEIDRASQHGQIGLILRREGLYTSHLTDWRRWRDRLESGEAAPVAANARGQRPSELRREIERLQRKNQRQEEELKHSRLLIELQKKLNRTMQELDEMDSGERRP